ncbi:MAG TPA: dUTP diphosphatase [Thermoplasmata archaeon]|nr:dUTP diphosphatase [Thermoplasmata archaeon]
MPRRSRAIVVERIPGSPDVPLPERATAGSACFDLASAESVDLERSRVTLVRTGVKMRCPRGTFLEVRPRSGLASRGVLMMNAPGTIDSDYSGEVRVPLTYLFEGKYHVEVGDRIAQVRLVADDPGIFRSGPVDPVASRRGGFGSTGR